MADEKSASSNVLFITMGVVVLGLIALSIAWLFVDGEPMETESAETGSEIQVIDAMEKGLVVTNFQYDHGQRVVEGTVMNNTAMPYVNVQVAFALYDSSGDQLAVVRDTASEVKPGSAWLFNALVPPGLPVTEAVPTGLTGGQKDVTGEMRDPSYPPVVVGGDSLGLEARTPE